MRAGRFRLLQAVALFMAAAPGCGERRVNITGTLTKNGEPFKVSPTTLVTLVFAPDGEKQDQTYPAKFSQETGGYQVDLPAGMYRVRYVIVEKDRPPLSAPPSVTKAVHDLTASKELNIEIPAR